VFEVALVTVSLLYVTNVLNVVVAEPYVQPLNCTVVFLKETAIVVTSDTWRIALNIDLSTYREIVYTIRTDLFLVEQQKKEFTPTSELKQIEIFLNTLESKLNEFCYILPRLDRQRALVDFGGKVLKALFVTATASGIHL
jgi:hypothetical protein